MVTPGIPALTLVRAMERAPIAKILPPSGASGLISRPRLLGLVETALQRRLTTMVAEAGFGKSTLLASWWDAAPCAWYTADAGDDLSTMGRRLFDALQLRVPDLAGDVTNAVESGGPAADQLARADTLASRMAEALHGHLTSDLLLLIDDVQALDASGPCVRLIEGLCRHGPAKLHVVLSGRRATPFPVERLRGQGQLLEVGGSDLAFTRAEVRELVGARLGAPSDRVTAHVHRVAGGWPAAVILAVEALRGAAPAEWGGVLANLDRRGAPLLTYLAEEVFAHQTVGVRRLVSRLALVDAVSPDRCDALGLRGAAPLLTDLAHQGLLVEERPDGSMALRPLIREFALAHLPVPPRAAASFRLRVAERLHADGDTAAALRVLIGAGAVDRVTALIETTGRSLVAHGHGATVLDACALIPLARRSAVIDEVEGEAQQVRGESERALACFQRAAAAYEGLPAHLAWRIGLIHYLRGDPATALEVYARALDDTHAAIADRALLLAWTATAHWLLGEVDPCRQLATDAMAAAGSSGDRRALAAAHTVMAMLAALDGDRRANDAHYLMALRAAEEAPDILQAVRIRTNRGSHFLEEGAYAEALQELEVALRLAELTSFASFAALSLSNRGETKLRQGRLDEALADFDASRERYQAIASDMVAYPLVGIGEVYRERGNLAQAHAAFEEAVTITERSGDIQGRVPALAGLALVIAGDDPERARQMADQAVACGTGLGYVAALLASGWVAAAAHDMARAHELAGNAAAAARARRDRAGLAESLTLMAVSGGEPHAAPRQLSDAAAIWKEVGNPLGEAKVELVQATLERSPGAALRRRRAERQLEIFGVRANVGGSMAAGPLAVIARAEQPPVRISALGGFAVIRDGDVVRVSEWQSKRARELLKVLVARRGRPAARPSLIEVLWPGQEEADRLSNRLSVALTTIRGVLDPARRYPSEHFITADGDVVALNLDTVDVDLEAFLASAGDGLARMRAGDVARALPALEAASGAYAGDFLEENAYDDWAVPPREEARAAFIAVSRALASEASAHHDTDRAVAHYLRVLEVDRYDEAAQLALVDVLSAAGRHGEAHRHFLSYRRAMAELGVEPVAFPTRREVATAAFTQP